MSQQNAPLSDSEMTSRESKADDVFEKYKLGNDDMDDGNVTVNDHDRWNTDDPQDFTKIVYVSYHDDPSDADSSKISFHVRFDELGQVDEAYALDMESGNEIGWRGDLRLDSNEKAIFLENLIKSHTGGLDEVYAKCKAAYGASHEQVGGESNLDYVKRCVEQDMMDADYGGSIFQEFVVKKANATEKSTSTEFLEGIIKNHAVGATKFQRKPSSGLSIG